MNKLTIAEPIWNGGKYCVGVAEFRCDTDLFIDIAWKDRFGNRRFPDRHLLEAKVGLRYPIHYTKDGTKLHLIPIDDLINIDKLLYVH